MVEKKSTVPKDPAQSDAFLTVKKVIKDQASKINRVPNMAIRLHQDEESFRIIEEHFLKIKDKDGVPMIEICKAYWNRKRRG